MQIAEISQDKPEAIDPDLAREGRSPSGRRCGLRCGLAPPPVCRSNVGSNAGLSSPRFRFDEPMATAFGRSDGPEVAEGMPNGPPESAD